LTALTFLALFGLVKPLAFDFKGLAKTAEGASSLPTERERSVRDLVLIR